MKCNNGKSTAVIGLENIMQLIDLQRSHTTFRKENNDEDSSNRWRKKIWFSFEDYSLGEE